MRPGSMALRTALASLLALVDAGCSSSPAASPDGSRPVAPSCGAPSPVRDDTSVLLDPTSARATIPARCPNGSTLDGLGRAPAIALRYEVPGSGLRAVTISTVNDRTAVATDTVIAVYRGDCDAARIAVACFDDTRALGRYERRASGAVLARGGESLTFVVGYFDDAETLGAAWVDVSSRENRPPEIASADALFLADRVTVWASASDADGNDDVKGLEIAFVGPLGELVRVDARTVFGVAATRIGDAYEANLPVLSLPAAIEGVLVRAVDASGTPSDGSVTARRRDGRFAGVGEPCDGARGPRVCLGELECAAGVCRIGAAAASVCGLATPLVFTTEASGLATARTSITIPSGAGAIRYPFEQCPEGVLSEYPPRTQGREVAVSVPLPPGRWDLLATTSGARPLDTILYARASCTDPGSSLGCADDRNLAAGDYFSDLELRDLSAPAEGRMITLIAELWDGAEGTTAETFDLLVTLRPVRRSGERCDTGFRSDRCEGMPCRMGICP